MYSQVRGPTSGASSTTLSPVASSSSDGGMAPSSLTSGTSRTSRTSLTTWGEDTVVPSAAGTDIKYVSPFGRMMDEDGEELLIDMSDEAILPPSFRTETNGSGLLQDTIGREPSPAEKLKLLLKQMDAEIRDTTPLGSSSSRRAASATVSTRSDSSSHGRADPQGIDGASSSASDLRSAWREGRRRVGNAGNSSSRRTSGSGSLSTVDLLDEPIASERIDEESPPTPPRRFGNLSISRTTRPQSWIPTRAAVLQASTSDSADPVHTPPTALETYIAQSSPSHQHQSPLNRLDTSGSSSSSSRKGKERARFDENDATQSNPRFTRFRPSDDFTPRKSSFERADAQRTRTHTPKKYSVDLAPDPDEFAEHAEGVEVRGQELDLESEESGDPPWGVEESRHAGQSRIERSPGHDRTLRALRTPHAGIEDTEQTPLPALPQPSDDDTEDEEQSPSSRRATMFRSPSKSSRSVNRFAKLSHPVRDPASPQSPRAPMENSTQPALDESTSTPSRAALGMGQQVVSPFPTPHPPGRWSIPSKSANRSAADDDSLDVHRIKLSPALLRVSPRRMEPASKEEDTVPGDTSFLARLGLTSKRTPDSPSVVKSPPRIPPGPSQTLVEAQEAIKRAASTSIAARQRVEMTQRQWLEALAAAQSRWGDGAVVAVKRGWSWSNWAWWIGVEALLLWSVFRVTLDYASSAAFLSSLDPYAIHLPPTMALSVPLPSAISAFLVPRTSANFFDLFESSELWCRLESWGFEGVQSGVLGEGARILGGVPS